MKIICLNTWCGKLYEPLKDFITHQSSDTDIFCFQEVRNGEYLNQPKEEDERINLYSDITEMLKDFTGHYSEMAPGVGMATFVRNSLLVNNVESTEILGTEEICDLKMLNGCNYYPRLIQSIYLKDSNIVVHNFHGIPGSFKKDTPERDLQTERLMGILERKDKSHVIVGDFNLDMNTETVSKLSADMRNLLKENNIKCTRNHNYKDFETLPYSDYAFISKNIEVVKFGVLDDIVSDHYPLMLEFK